MTEFSGLLGLRTYLTSALIKAVANHYPALIENHNLVELYPVIESKLGDICSPAPNRVAALTRVPPKVIYSKIRENFVVDTSFIEPFEPHGSRYGFLNFRVSDAYLNRFLLQTSSICPTVDCLLPPGLEAAPLSEMLTRIQGLLRHCNKTNSYTENLLMPIDQLHTKEERELLRLCLQAETLCNQVDSEINQRAVQYANTISIAFTKFFRACSLFSKDTKKNCARFTLTQSTFTVICTLIKTKLIN